MASRLHISQHAHALAAATGEVLGDEIMDGSELPNQLIERPEMHPRPLQRGLTQASTTVYAYLLYLHQLCNRCFHLQPEVIVELHWGELYDFVRDLDFNKRLSSLWSPVPRSKKDLRSILESALQAWLHLQFCLICLEPVQLLDTIQSCATKS